MRADGTPREPMPLWVTVLVWVSVVGIVFYFFNVVAMVFLLLLAAAAVAALLRPLSRGVSQRAMRGGLVVGLGFWLIFAGFLGLLGALLYAPVAEQFDRWPETERNINEMLQTLAMRVGIEAEVTLSGFATGLFEWLANQEEVDVVAQVVDGLGVIVVALAVLVFGSTFLLIEPPGRLTGPTAQLLPDAYVRAVRATFGDIDFRLRWWLLGIIVSMSAVGVASGFGFWLAGLEFWLPLAIFAGLAEIVPVLGPTVVFLIVLLFAATQGTSEIVGVVIVWAVVQVLEPYVLVPMVMRKAVAMPPVVTLFTVVLWAQVFGLMGLLLAIPINVVLWSAVSNLVLKRRAADRGPPTPA